PEVKAAALRIEDIGPGDIAREEIGRELDPPKRREIDARIAADRLAERPRERRLSRAREVFEQHMTVSDERDEQQIDDLVAPLHRRLQPRLEPLEDGARVKDRESDVLRFR